MNTLEDSEIVELYLSREESAIRATSEKYGSRLQALARGIVLDQQTAEECENDTYLAVWNAIPPHEPRNYLFAFLAKITRQLALNCCRDRSRLKRRASVCELSREMEECIPAPDDVECRLNELVLQNAINEFLERISGEKRNMFLRRYWFLDSVASISQRFGCSESKVKTTLFRTRKELREYLEKEGYDL